MPGGSALRTAAPARLCGDKQCAEWWALGQDATRGTSTRCGAGRLGGQPLRDSTQGVCLQCQAGCKARLSVCVLQQCRRTRQPAARAEHDIYGCPLCILFGRGVALCGPSHRRQAAGAALRPLRRAVGTCQQATLAPNGPVQRERWQSQAHEQEGCRQRRRAAGAGGGGGKQWRRQCRRLWGAFLTLFDPRCGHLCGPSGLAAQRCATSDADLLCGRGLSVVGLLGNFPGR